MDDSILGLCIIVHKATFESTFDLKRWLKRESYMARFTSGFLPNTKSNQRRPLSTQLHQGQSPIQGLKIIRRKCINSLGFEVLGSFLIWGFLLRNFWRDHLTFERVCGRRIEFSSSGFSCFLFCKSSLESWVLRIEEILSQSHLEISLFFLLQLLEN